MSVIAWDGFNLATDSAAFSNGRMYRMDKLIQKDTAAYAICGMPGPAMEYIGTGKAIVPSEDMHFTVIGVDAGEPWVSESGYERPVTGTPIVEGQDLAIGMVRAYIAMGFSAPESIKAAINLKFSDSVFGPVQYWNCHERHIRHLPTFNDIP